MKVSKQARIEELEAAIREIMRNYTDIKKCILIATKALKVERITLQEDK